MIAFPRRLLASGAVAGLLVLSACGSPPPPRTHAQIAADYMREISAQPDVKTLPSGLAYKVLASGPQTGPHPAPQDSVLVNYVGKLSDGATFDSSEEHGGGIATLPLAGVIPGWREGLQLMRPGDKWMLYIPPALAYGSKGVGPIPPDTALQFRVELVAISGKS
ncbi:FKBP-type peptidyl-prolyl cis-trans isomerase [Rhizosaccharibacter radicis]|uniref:Peptidyl-prolyl cis-trans isomerase n=1 Tax=Rhizosaccharibacter radicis TaxID=2782605 RepID=A0ABT1VV58_9PROT|nr:FKBP-type peptidyl-prolyl cis-trans isomerase [Acetobacteraceae bacterium KSS12]